MTDERRAFVEALRDFARRECGTTEQWNELTEHGEESHHPGLYSKLAELGYLGAGVEEEYGGGGGTIIDACLLMEESFYAKLPLFGLTTSLTVAEALARHASEEQKHELLGGLCAGVVHALGFSEPEAGSDLASLRCKARRTDDGWVIDGQKTWTSNAQFSERMLLMARTGAPDSAHKGISMLNIPLAGDGVEIRPIDTMGGREVNDVFFTEHVVPEDCLDRSRERGLGPAAPGPEPGAPADRRDVPRPGAARVRRRARLRQGAQAVRPHHRQLPDHAPPLRRARHRDRVLPPARLRPGPAHRGRARRGPCRARARWSSSRSPRPPSAWRSRACR